ncbi:hypothetical protein BS50DRAFT_569557 [Corynespora cassiicola Philippines]|uniref:CBM1 domain-containing protein n=1 Tax=Corynespora cassiicola Philippines TaxID=1448308 RepID=A0A2T2P2W1_CORCC|nr:hypothetical protein BS50DRAFT_569557 [Corynespora cassiicola Philippines]
MQFTAIFALIATVSFATASALPQSSSTKTGACGIDSYNLQHFCIIDGVSFGCATGTCEGRSGSEFPCSGADGTYTCPS